MTFTKEPNKFYLYYLFLFALLPLPLLSETIIFKDGRILKGKLLQYHSETIDIKTEDGQFLTIDRGSILKVQYHEDHETERPKKLLEKDVQEKETKRTEVENVETKPEVVLVPKNIQETSNSPNYMRQSAILPGLGIRSLGRKEEGYLITGFFFLSTFIALHHRNEYEKSKMDYETSIQTSLILSYTTQNIFPGIWNSRQKYNEYLSEEAEYNKAVLLCGAVYLTQLVWTYYLGKTIVPEKNAFEFQLLPITNMANGHATKELDFPIQAHLQYQYRF